MDTPSCFLKADGVSTFDDIGASRWLMRASGPLGFESCVKSLRMMIVMSSRLNKNVLVPRMNVSIPAAYVDPSGFEIQCHLVPLFDRPPQIPQPWLGLFEEGLSIKAKGEAARQILNHFYDFESLVELQCDQS